MRSLIQTENLVNQVLSENPKAKDDDKFLIIKVWELQGLILTPSQQEYIFHCSPAESITRARRKLQEKGLFQASSHVKKHRAHQEIKYREYFGWSFDQNGKAYKVQL